MAAVVPAAPVLVSLRRFELEAAAVAGVAGAAAVDTATDEEEADGTGETARRFPSALADTASVSAVAAMVWLLDELAVAELRRDLKMDNHERARPSQYGET